MGVSGFLPAFARRGFVAISAAAMLGAASGPSLLAQTPQTAPAPAPQDPFKFAMDGPIVVLVTIKGDAAADFEKMMGTVKADLAKSTKDARKQQAAHWKVSKGGPIPSNGMFIFFWYLDTVVKDASYNPFEILYESGAPQAEIDPLYKEFATTGNIVSITPLPYTSVVDMGGSL